MDLDSILFIGAANIFALLITIVMVIINRVAKQQEKFYFILVFSLLIMLIISECGFLYIDGKSPKYIGLNVFLNFLAFAVTPFLALLLGGVVSKFKMIKGFLIFDFIYIILVLTTQWTKLIFYVDSNNIYHRGNLYLIFYFACIINVIYMLISTVKLSIRLQKQNKVLLYIIFFYLILESFLNILESRLYVTWIVFSFVCVLFYAYWNDIWQNTDSLTGVLNHGSYLREIANPKKEMILEIFDVNEFKHVNDSKGHLFGDNCLQTISKVMLKIYGKYGLVFRIGGDEFAVILYKEIEDLEKLNQLFLVSLKIETIDILDFPSISIGYSKYHKGDITTDIVNEADKMMYENKEKLKIKNIKND